MHPGGTKCPVAAVSGHAVVCFSSSSSSSSSSSNAANLSLLRLCCNAAMAVVGLSSGLSGGSGGARGGSIVAAGVADCGSLKERTFGVGCKACSFLSMLLVSVLLSSSVLPHHHGL